MKAFCLCIALALFFLTALVRADGLSFSSVINYDDAHPSNIVAVVIGYQNMVKHKTGVTVPVFSLEDGSGDGKERGVLFFVLAPTNYAGYIFLADCLKDSFSDAQTVPSEKLYPKDVLLSFRLSDFPIRWMLKSHCYIDPHDQLATGHLASQRYLSSEQEATIYLTQLKNQLDALEAEHEIYKKKTDEEEQALITKGILWYKNDNREETKAYRECNTQRRAIGYQIGLVRTSFKDAESQLVQLQKRLHKTTKTPRDKPEGTGE
jgi:hypothetical protein